MMINNGNTYLVDEVNVGTLDGTHWQPNFSWDLDKMNDLFWSGELRVLKYLEILTYAKIRGPITENSHFNT